MMQGVNVVAVVWVLLGAGLLGACTSTRPPPVVDQVVDLDRFMGKWYVIAGKFTYFERDAYNAVERYALNEDGTIATTFTFRRGGFDGPKKTFTPKGFVHDETSNAEWRMQFIWPFKAAYLILYLDDDYQHTAIGVPSRKYLWIMARTPEIEPDKMAEIKERLTDVGYALDDVEQVPHQWD